MRDIVIGMNESTEKTPCGTCGMEFTPSKGPELMLAANGAASPICPGCAKLYAPALSELVAASAIGEECAVLCPVCLLEFVPRTADLKRTAL